MKFKKIAILFLAVVIVLQISAFSVSAGYNGDAYIFTYTWNNLNTRPSGKTEVLRHLWNMGYNAGEYLNNGAPSVISTFPSARIIVIASHGESGKAQLGSENNISWLYGNANTSGNDRSLSNLSTGSLSNMRIVLHMTCYSGKTSLSNGNLVVETRIKGAKCVVGWNDVLENDSANDWTRLFFEHANQSHEPIWKCFNHADYWVRDIFGDFGANLLKDRNEKGNINQYLYDIPD